MESIKIRPIDNEKTVKRYEFIDYCKFIGIYLVILGHRPLPGFLNNFIFSFHIPLFFLISGFLFSFNKHKTYKDFFKARARQLLIPYLFFNIITYIFWVTIGQRFGGEDARSVVFYKPLIGIFYGNGIYGYLQHCVPIWFLACLFTVENIYYLVFAKIEKKWLLLIGMLVIGYIDYHFSFPRLPWGINLAPTAIVFYGVGNLYKKYIIKYMSQTWWRLLAIACAFLVITITISYVNGNVSMNDRLYGQYLYFICSGFCGTLFLLSLSSLVAMLFKQQSFVRYVSMNTIIIIAFHNIIATLMKGVVSFVFKMPLSIFENAVWLNVAFSIISLFLAIPVIYILNTHFPYLLGRRNKPIVKSVAGADA